MPARALRWAAVLVSSLLVVAIAVAGAGLTSWTSPALRFEERLAIGIVVGVTAFSVVTFGVFVLVGMGWPAVGIGLAVPAAGAGAGFHRHRKRWSDEISSARRRAGLPTADSRSLRPLVAITALAAVVSTRILSLAYQTTPQGRSAGSLAIWGDWSAHLAYAGSFAYGDNRRLDLPIATGEGFRYHFLVDFFGALFTVTGATLEQSMVISAWMLAIALPPLLWFAVIRLTRSRLTAGLTLVLFTLSGGLGGWYFARDVENMGWGILTSLPRTYARIPEAHIWVDNTISASFYAQRSTQLGWSLGACALILILASRPRWDRRGFAFAGVLIGLTGIAQAHMLATAIALGTMALLADRRRTWWWFLVPAVVIGLPLTWSIRPETNSMRWMLGWMAADADQPWPWFWLLNVGLLFPLFAGLAILGGVPRRLRRLTAPLWLWFVAANVIAFHPSEWNNTKFFLFWQFAGCLVIAAWLSRAFAAETLRRPAWARSAIQMGAASIAIVMVSAGGLDTVRAMQRSTAIAWVDHDDLAAAEWLRNNSSSGDVIVYGAHNTSAVAALGGRSAVTGYVGWTYDLGLVDWVERWSATGAILRGDANHSDEIDRYGVDFVVIGPVERREFQASDDHWAQHGTLVFEQGDHRIYRP
jgi:hypothetical protein